MTNDDFMTDKKQILGTSKSEDDSLVTAKQQSNSETDEMPKVFLVKTIREPVSDNPFPKEDFNIIELTPSDLELLKKLIKYCFEYGIVDDSDDSLTSIHLKALLKKLSDLKC